MADTLDLIRLPCICHVLSNFFKTVFECSLIAPVLKKAKSTASLLCKSLVVRGKFYSFAKIVKPGAKCPRAFSATRWAGAFLLLRDYINSIEVLRSVPELVENYPSTDEKDTALVTINLLEDVFAVMTSLEADSSTASSTVPNLVALDNYLSNHPQNSTRMGKIVKNEFRKRTSDLIKSMDYLIPTIVDPRFAFHRSSLGKTNWSKVEKLFLTTFGNHPYYDSPEHCTSEARNDDVLDNSSSSKSVPDMSKQKRSPLESLLNNEDVDEKNTSCLKEEITRYKNFLLQTSRPNHDSDPLDFWRINTANFPLLSAISRELLSIPSSSAATERCFSRASYLYSNPRRNRLNQTTLDALLQVSARAHLISDNSKIFCSKNPDSEDDFSEEEEEADPMDPMKPGCSTIKAEKRRRNADDDVNGDECEVFTKKSAGTTELYEGYGATHTADIRDEMETSSDEDN